MTIGELRTMLAEAPDDCEIMSRFDLENLEFASVRIGESDEGD